MRYFDYTANTPADPRVIAAFAEAEQTYFGNPNGRHWFGRTARAFLDRTTESIAARLGIRPDEVIYTSGSAEANNLAIKGIIGASGRKTGHVIFSALEHSTVRKPVGWLLEQGFDADVLELRPDGKADTDKLRALLRKDTLLVAVCAVDSELGIIQPIREISEILKDRPDCAFHVDATQAVGKIPFSFEGIDTVSLSAHKFFGLNGCGMLYKRADLPLEPQIHGGASTTAYRSGTPALALAASLDKALELALAERDERLAVTAARNAALRTGLAAYPLVRFNSPADAIPHILNVSVTGVRADRFRDALEEEGISVSIKSACADVGTPSGAVLAVTGDRENAFCSWRIGISHLTTEEDIAAFLRAFDACYRRLVPAS